MALVAQRPEQGHSDLFCAAPLVRGTHRQHFHSLTGHLALVLEGTAADQPTQCTQWAVEQGIVAQPEGESVECQVNPARSLDD